jgi:hypothetical protein
VEHLDAASGKTVSHGAVQMPVTPEPQSIPYRIIVIAKDGEYARGRLERGKSGRGSANVLVTAMNKITGQRNQVRRFRHGQFDGLGHVSWSNVTAAVKIRKLDDAKAIESFGQIFDIDFEPIDFQPCRLDSISVADPRPVPANQAGQSTAASRFLGLGPEPSNHLSQHQSVRKRPCVCPGNTPVTINAA